jgi:hypothetical protein
MNDLLLAVGRQPAAALQLGPLVVVRADGRFEAVLLVEESDMDGVDERTVTARPDVALAWLGRWPPAYRLDLAPLLATD